MRVKCLTCGRTYDIYLWQSCPYCGDDNGFSPLEKEETKTPDPIDDYLEREEPSFDPLSDPLFDDPYGDH
ncbi:MAG: hypothetical protein II467_00930 [Bacilli bacterium]|nr:hypothetical protein [Bacilli bacterium]MBQ4255460.1 hypothetical protein [Bacilli bacterium]